jgi:hypothetical protein
MMHAQKDTERTDLADANHLFLVVLCDKKVGEVEEERVHVRRFYHLQHPQISACACVGLAASCAIPSEQRVGIECIGAAASRQDRGRASTLVMRAWSAAVAPRKPSPSGASHACTPSAPLTGRAPCLLHARSCPRPCCCEVACPLRKVLRTSQGRSSERVGSAQPRSARDGSAHPEAGDDRKACVPATLISTDSASTTNRAPDPCTMAARLQF